MEKEGSSPGGDGSVPVKAAFGQLAVAVAVITTLDGSEPHGCTGMAWAEHASPPLLLTTLRSDGRTRQLVAATGRFGVNVLAEQQTDHVHRFAARLRTPASRFDGIPFRFGARLAVPLLEGCVASFECEVADIHPFGGHDIVVGRVAWASARDGGHPLVHCDGALWSLRRTGG